MGERSSVMQYKRRYIQFNDFVFDGYDMISESPHQAQFKTSSQEYSYGHGSYVAFKQNYPFAKEQSVSLMLTLKMLKLPCDMREFYKQYAVREVTKPGKLWAVVNNELVWAYAYITSYSEGQDAIKDEYIINLDLSLPEGVWHKADLHRTFITPYDVCTYMECKGYQPKKSCLEVNGDCCTVCQDNRADARANEEDCGCCCCDKITKDMALCNHLNDLQDLYNECSPGWQIKYSCRKGHEFFGDEGDKICTKDSCSNMITGMFYSDTEMPTTGVEIVIDGQVKNVAISINDNMNIINGEYYGLRIKPNGDVYSISKDKCCETLLSPEVWEMPSYDMEYGWTVEQGMNRVVIDRGSCCGRACAYIRADNLTI